MIMIPKEVMSKNIWIAPIAPDPHAPYPCPGLVLEAPWATPGEEFVVVPAEMHGPWGKSFCIIGLSGCLKAA